MHRCGTVAVIGRPNVGKSTLVNQIVGQKVSIVSDKAQTTRRRVIGIATEPEWQIIFLDTPGLHEAHTQLNRLLNESARSAIPEADVILIMVDSSRMPGKDDRILADILKKEGVYGKKKTLLCMNKMDSLKADSVQRNYDAYTELFPAPFIMMTSLTKRQNVDKLLDGLLDSLPEGPPLFPEDEFTDQSVRFMAAEFIREKALQLTRQEVPHALAVSIAQWEEHQGRLVIAADILVEKEGQKAILIGKKGSMLKEIGTKARLEIEELTGQKVFLELFVKVRDNWRSNLTILNELDYFTR